ncbi:hypothetical protein FRC11_008418 [Ceratobasidium sp. 423]|nr:hypothetical protein FRC11_008418 [Ceratobasidium sp. 423]
MAAIGGPQQLSLLATIFTVDVASDPGPILAILEGSVNFGLAISFALGGLITRWSGSGAAPCINALVSASVEPLAQGEVLAVVALIRSIAEFLSPVIMGSILSSTTNSCLLELVFFVSSILLSLAVGIVVLIRDADKYVSENNVLLDNTGLTAEE